MAEKYGASVRRRREALGWSLDELARRTGTDGVSRAQVANIELGKTKAPRRKTVEKIERALDASWMSEDA